jgi:LPXTG-motif cell wall anchor domain protein
MERRLKNLLPQKKKQLSTTPEKPVKPKPQEPKKVLPHTGETASMALMLGGISVGLLGFGLAKRKEQQ